MRRREAPIKRVNPSGDVVWVARYTGADGKRRYAKPTWNRGKAAFHLKRDAQRAIDEAYALPDRDDTVGHYLDVWLERYPRSDRTNATNKGRIKAVLDVEIDGRPLSQWPIHELRKRHALAVVDVMLRVQGRAATGAANIIRSLSAMTEDAITDELADVNAFKGLRIRKNDPRARKSQRPVRVWGFDQTRNFAAAGRPEVRRRTVKPNKHRRSGEDLHYSAQDYQPMLLTFAFTNLRLGEVLSLRRDDFDGETLHVRGTAHAGRVIEGDTEEKRHIRDVPCPPSLAEVLGAMVPRIDTDILFPTPMGRVWWERNFYRDVWEPAQIASGMDIRPHECRHSWITLMRAAGIDPADLAEVCGHDVETATRHYTRPLGRSMDQIRAVIG